MNQNIQRHMPLPLDRKEVIFSRDSHHSFQARQGPLQCGRPLTSPGAQQVTTSGCGVAEPPRLTGSLPIKLCNKALYKALGLTYGNDGNWMPTEKNPFLWNNYKVLVLEGTRKIIWFSHLSTQ